MNPDVAQTAAERKRLARAATTLAALFAPVVALWEMHGGTSVAWSVVVAVIAVAFVRGGMDVLLRKLVPMPDLFGASKEELDQDARDRRRHYYWLRKYRLLAYLAAVVTGAWVIRGHELAFGAWTGSGQALYHGLYTHLANVQTLQQLIILPIFFLFNFVILMGPMMAMGISQMRGFEPGDADWGVKLEDVRGQKEAKEEIRKVITLWQSGDRFVKAGGKRERGILFLGAPGTGKTMLAKAIATGFNCPIVTMPGSGFAQTFIGMDVIIVRFMMRKARKLASKWGGTCLVFIDEIDAVGMRRQSLGPQRATKEQMPGGMMGGMMGGMAINSLLVAMDGIDNPPFVKKTVRSRVNTWLDALYVVPARLGRFPLRLPRARPTGNQIYFIGATNVPLEMLDPALVRPGRMGRHIHFRKPTQPDREDIFDLYLGKVMHDPELDAPEARKELARVTTGYSPAEIEQVVSMALTYAQHNGRLAFGREDILEAMVTIEAGTAIGWEYIPKEEKQIAIHEAGHAVCGHLFMADKESTRLSVRRRGHSGGHHSAREVEERFVLFKGEVFAEIVWGLGSLAAEQTFYGEQTQGVTGDLQGVTATAATMVGRWGMSAPALEPLGESGDKEREKAFERIGQQLMQAAGPGDIAMSRDKTSREARIIGQAYCVAWHTIQHNRLGVEKIANVLCDRKELYGDDLLSLLNGAGLEVPEIDWAKASFPVI